MPSSSIKPKLLLSWVYFLSTFNPARASLIHIPSASTNSFTVNSPLCLSMPLAFARTLNPNLSIQSCYSQKSFRCPIIIQVNYSTYTRWLCHLYNHYYRLSFLFQNCLCLTSSLTFWPLLFGLS